MSRHFERLVAAEAAIAAHRRIIVGDAETSVVDLIADLLTLADARAGKYGTPEHANETAWMHFMAERVGQVDLEEIKRRCGYDETGDTGVDSLIEYKNALEDLVGRLTS